MNKPATDKSSIEFKTIKCNDCGGSMRFDAENSVMCCPFCGSNQIIVESDYVNLEKFKIRNKKDVELEEIRTKARNEDNEDRRSVVKIAIVAAAFILMCVVFTIHDHLTETNISKSGGAAVKASCSSDDLEGKDIDDVTSILEKNGFENVQLLGEDTGLLSLTKSGKVTEVTIDGTYLTEGSIHSSNDLVIVKYYKK